MKPYLAVLIILTLTNTAYAEDNTIQIEIEDACEMALQGKVIWDHKDNSEWADSQITNLCGKAQRSIQPAACFSHLMSDEFKQGNGGRWEWYNAIKLCKESLNARETITCYKQDINLNDSVHWKKTLAKCSAITIKNPVYEQVVQYTPPTGDTNKHEKTTEPQKIKKIDKHTIASSGNTTNLDVEPIKNIKTKQVNKDELVISDPEISTATLSRCESYFQEKIPWDYNGNKIWNIKNLQRLCKGAVNSQQPSICFNKAMHGKLNWGGGSNWEWRNALHLCEGVLNADLTINCFKDKISSGQSWKPAIAACHNLGVIAISPNT